MNELKKFWMIVSLIASGVITLNLRGGMVEFVLCLFGITIGGFIIFGYLYSLPAKSRAKEAEILKNKIKIIPSAPNVEYKVITYASVNAETYEDAISKLLIEADRYGADAVIASNANTTHTSRSYVDSFLGQKNYVNETETNVDINGVFIKYI